MPTVPEWWESNIMWGITKGAIMMLERDQDPHLQPRSQPVMPDCYYETVAAMGYDPLENYQGGT